MNHRQRDEVVVVDEIDVVEQQVIAARRLPTEIARDTGREREQR
jgi:hypothetical protein